MIKKLIGFTKNQVKWLTTRSKVTGNSLASIVRTAVDEYMQKHTIEANKQD